MNDPSFLKARRNLSRGFSLIEMAIVLLIMGLLLGGGLALLGPQIEAQKFKDTQRTLEDAKEALIGFALANGRLPRPATSTVNGTEDPVTCGVSEAICTGYIPWTTLGVNKLDAWGKVIRYSVTPAFTTTFTLSPAPTVPTKKIQTRDAAGTLVYLAGTAAACTTLNGCVPAVIFSHGKNNFGITNAGTAIPNSSVGATNLDEITNNNGAGPGVTFIQRTPSDNTAAAFGGEFDDIVTWLSPNILFNRMVQAGRLP